MWYHDYLYVLVEVTDTELDKTADQPFEQDSVQVFIEESNQKSTFYQDGDGHYRVNYDKDRKSTRLNSSHVAISYAVFCLYKKNNRLQFLISNSNHETH